MNQLSRTQHGFLLGAFALSVSKSQPFTKRDLMRAVSLFSWNGSYGGALLALVDAGYLRQSWRESKHCAYYELTDRGMYYLHSCFTD